ncbi:MAG TPA: branched-chain amino acid ABC transporter permease [Chloroflexia bacterium]|nr:branched-chain amino acid ABC transporter permease [Chloroflexia bacterium]
MQFFADFYASNRHLIDLIGVNAMLALSVYMTLSCAMLSLSNAASMAIGAYTAAVLTTQLGIGLWPAVIVGACMAGLVALLLGLPILRLRGVFLAISTIGFGEVVRIIIENIPSLGGSEGYRLNAGQFTATSGFWEIYIVLILLAYFFSRLKGSRMGLALEAIREDESAASTLGINVTFYKVAAYVTGAIIAGVAGALYAHALPVLLPGGFGFTRAVDILVYAVVGGTFAWRGAIAGAFLMTILSEVLRIIPPIGNLYIKDYPEIFSGLILLTVVLFLPNGLLSVALGLNRRRGPARPIPEQVRPDPHHSELGGDSAVGGGQESLRDAELATEPSQAIKVGYEETRSSEEGVTHPGASPREASG